MKTVYALRRILAHTLSGSFSYAACDIPTREQIDLLIPKLFRTFGKPLPENYWPDTEDKGGLTYLKSA